MHDICCNYGTVQAPVIKCITERHVFSACFCWLKGPAMQKVQGMVESNGSNKSHYLSFCLAQPLKIGGSVQLAVVLGQGRSNRLASSL